MGQEPFNPVGTHLPGVPSIVKEDVASHPVHVGFLGTNRIMFQANGVADLVEAFLLGRGFHLAHLRPMSLRLIRFGGCDKISKIVEDNLFSIFMFLGFGSLPLECCYPTFHHQDTKAQSVQKESQNIFVSSYLCGF